VAHVLVVDDEIGVRELLREILEDSGHRVTTASTAGEASSSLKADRPDLVLLDLSLPDDDGLSLIRAWSSGRSLRTPVVVLSGYASIDNAVEATRLGASDFLEKPISLEKLLAAVKRATSQHAAVESLAAPSPASQWPPAAGSLGPEWPQAVLGLPYREARMEFDRAYFLHALARDAGRQTEVAARTGLERTHLYRKIKALGLRSAHQAQMKLRKGRVIRR
jgi:DNA-binding NtrC family response regulator